MKRTSDGERNEQTLYDPSGSYQAPTGYGNGESIVAYTIETTPEEEAAMIEKAMSKGDGSGFDCANYVSFLLGDIGFKNVITPGGLESQLQESDKVTEVNIYEEKVDE